MWLKTSLAASGPWETKAVRRLRHWRTNLYVRVKTTLGLWAEGFFFFQMSCGPVLSSVDQPVVFRVQRSLQKSHVARNGLFHNSIANHVEVSQVTRCPQKDHLQALKNQHHLDRGRVGLEIHWSQIRKSVRAVVKAHLTLWVLVSL